MRVVTVARKPLSGGSVASNVLEHGCGALNIDGARVSGGPKQATAGNRTVQWGVGKGGSSYEKGTGAVWTNEGRWPANLILIHKSGCQPSGTQEVTGTPQDSMTPTTHDAPAKFGYSPDRHQFNYAGETVTTWECEPGCPVRALDEQSGLMVSKKSMRGVGYTGSEVFGDGDPDFDTERGYDDVGGASRFFKQVQEG